MECVLVTNGEQKNINVYVDIGYTYIHRLHLQVIKDFHTMYMCKREHRVFETYNILTQYIHVVLQDWGQCMSINHMQNNSMYGLCKFVQFIENTHTI